MPIWHLQRKTTRVSFFLVSAQITPEYEADLHQDIKMYGRVPYGSRRRASIPTRRSKQGVKHGPSSHKSNVFHIEFSPGWQKNDTQVVFFSLRTEPPKSWGPICLCAEGFAFILTWFSSWVRLLSNYPQDMFRSPASHPQALMS